MGLSQGQRSVDGYKFRFRWYKTTSIRAFGPSVLPDTASLGARLAFALGVAGCRWFYTTGTGTCSHQPKSLHLVSSDTARRIRQTPRSRVNCVASAELDGQCVNDWAIHDGFI